MGSIAAAGAEKKNALLLAMADSLEAHCAEILAANAEDMAARAAASPTLCSTGSSSMKTASPAWRTASATPSGSPDHTGRVLSEVVRPNGIIIDKVQVPLGLVAIIYESRPNVTSDAAALAVKSGNVCMLRSGKEAYRSARAIVAALKAGVAQAGGDPDIVNIVEDTSHASRAGADDRQGPRRSPHPARRRGPDPRLRGERHRPLHRDRHRHLPRLCGQGRRPCEGGQHHRQRQGQPALRLQRGGGLPCPSGTSRRSSCPCSKSHRGRPCRRRPGPRRAAAGPRRRADHPAAPRRGA